MFLFNKILFIRINCLSLHPRIKPVRIMTAIQLRAEEAGLAPRDGWATAAMQAHADGEDTLMVADVFEDEKMEDWKW
jgi:hypothetical protein